MKIECPNCNTVHQIDDTKIPENGAYARCRKCQSRFFIKKEVDKNDRHHEKSEKNKKIEKCPKCGHERKQGEESCLKCGIIYSKYLKKDKSPKPTVENVVNQKENKDESHEEKNRQPKKKLVNITIVISVIIALAISFIGYKIIEKHYDKIAKQKAEAEFSAVIESISQKMITLAIKSESIVDEINNVWRESIFSESKKRDFSEAIFEVMIDRAEDISTIKRLSNEITGDIKNITPPANKEKDFNRLKELYLLFNKYADMAISPSGSLQTYSQQNSQLSVEIKSAIKELEIMK